MSTAELKSDLHKFIVETDDPTILQKVKDFFLQLNVTSEDAVLSPQEERMLEIGLEQAEKGLLTCNKQVRAKINEWIKEKQQS